MEGLEEIHFAKLNGEDKYFLLHSIFTGKLLFPGQSQTIEDIYYDDFCWYLEGASFGKNNKKLHLYNGIPHTAHSLFSNKNLSPLKEEELEKLLFDARLKEKFKDKIKTIG
jgi:hypothetical protein